MLKMGKMCHCRSTYNILSLTASGERRYTLYTNSVICYYVKPVGTDLYSCSARYSEGPVFGPKSGSLQKWNEIDSAAPSREWYSDGAALGELIVGVPSQPTRLDDKLLLFSDDGYIYGMSYAGGFAGSRIQRWNSSGLLDKVATPIDTHYSNGIKFAGSGIQATSIGTNGRIYDYNSDLSLGALGRIGGPTWTTGLNLINSWPVTGGWVELSTSFTHLINEAFVLERANNFVVAGLLGAVAETPDTDYLYIASISAPSRLSKVQRASISGVMWPPGTPAYGGFEWQINHSLNGDQQGNDPATSFNFWGLTADGEGGVWMFNKTTLKHYAASGGTNDATITMPGSLVTQSPLGIMCVRQIPGSSDVLVIGNFYGAADPNDNYNVARVAVGSTTPLWKTRYSDPNNESDFVFSGQISDAGDIYLCGSTVEL